MIFSADNPLAPYMQFYDKRTKQPIRNVVSYDTITGEGITVGSQTKVIPHLANVQSTEISIDRNTGKPILTYFTDKKNVEIVISIPTLKYEEFGRYIYQEIMRAPEHNNQPDKVKIRLQFTREYVDKRGADKNIRLSSTR